MAKTIELSYALRNGQPSIQIHVTEVVEGNVKEKIQEILNDLPDPITNSLKNISQARLLTDDEVEVQDVPFLKSPTAKRQSFKSGGLQKITDRQLWCIKDHLKKMDINEKEFCQTHGVDCLEDLPKDIAICIVGGIKNQ